MNVVSRTRLASDSRSLRGGFTLIELIVVIAVIGILTTVILASVNAAREQARIARVMTDIREIERALVTYRTEYLDAWPEHESGESGESGLTIESLIAGTALPTDNPITGNEEATFPVFNRLLSEAPEFPDTDIYYFYNNFGSEHVCGQGLSHRTGVSIRIGDIRGTTISHEFLDKVYEAMEESFDEGVENVDSSGVAVDPAECGRVRTGGSSGSLYYLIAENSYDVGL